jgi:hypothetical protein
MSQIPLPEAKLTPEYWGGHDIFNEALFQEAPHVPGTYLKYEKFKYARDCLHENVGQVALGNGTEIRYRAGAEFDPELEEGSLVVIDSEHLARWIYDDPEYSWDEGVIREEGPVIARPYSDYWRNNQNGTAEPIPLGSESVSFVEDLAMYTRSVQWGIIVHQAGARLIQPFFFGTTKLLPNGQVYSPRAQKKDLALHGQALRMPVPIGAVEVRPRLTLERCAIDALDRVRSIDVVYPAAGGKQPAQSAKRGLGRLLIAPQQH